MFSTANQLQRLKTTRILVVGDLILDHYIRGTTERSSPEAPVPVVNFREEEYIPGGAANVARSVAAAGGTAHCFGYTGDDKYGTLLKNQITAAGADSSGVVMIGNASTTVKTRIVSQGQQIVRLDRDSISKPDLGTERNLICAIEAGLESAGAVIASDYAKGVLTEPVIEALVRRCSQLRISLFMDPKGRDYSKYRGAYALTPNAREAYEATGVRTDSPEGLRGAAQAIRAVTGCELILITRGAEGLALFYREEEPFFLPALAREIFDVTGAGDTFVAWMAMATAAGLDPRESARIANAAAGVAVGKSGAAAVSITEARAALMPSRLGRKLLASEDLGELGRDLRSSGKRIVFTNGCFDFLHAGHVAFMHKARELGDVLVVATNTDEMITRLKGAPRPVIHQEQREALLASIETVDYVTPFSQETPHELLRDLRPDILVKGGNYSLDQIEGAEVVREYGGQVITLEIIHDISTEQLLSQRKAAY